MEVVILDVPVKLRVTIQETGVTFQPVMMRQNERDPSLIHAEFRIEHDYTHPIEIAVIDRLSFKYEVIDMRTNEVLYVFHGKSYNYNPYGNYSVELVIKVDE